MEQELIGFDEINEAFIEMLEVWSRTESDPDCWPDVEGLDSDAVDEWTENWAQAASLMAMVGSAEHRDVALTAEMHLKMGIALGFRCAQIAAAEETELSEPPE